MPAIPRPLPAPAADGIVLRAWTLEDIDDAHRGALDPLVPKFTGVAGIGERATVVRYFEAQEERRANGEEIAFAVADAVTDRFLGALASLPLDVIVAKVDVDNPASITVLKRQGFVRERTRAGKRCEEGIYVLRTRGGSDRCGGRVLAHVRRFALSGTGIRAT